MIKISQAIQELIHNNSMLEFGLSHGLLNLSRTAEFLKPLLEVRTKKSISKSAVLMSLSRQQKIKAKILAHLDDIKLTNLNVHTNLCELTYFNTPGVHAKLETIYKKVQKHKGHISISQGLTEITLLFDKKFFDFIRKTIGFKPKFIKTDLGALGIQFDPKYIEHVGMIYYLIQQLALQNINIWEFSSTFTEITFYLESKDVQFAFDTLYQRFML